MKRFVLIYLIISGLLTAATPGFGVDRNQPGRAGSRPDGYVYSSYIGRYLFAFDRHGGYQHQGIIVYPVQPANRHTVYFVDGNSAAQALKYSRKGNLVIFDQKKKRELLTVLTVSDSAPAASPAVAVDTLSRVAARLLELDDYLIPEARYSWATTEMRELRRLFQGPLTIENLNNGLRQYTIYVVNPETLCDEWKQDRRELHGLGWLRRLLANRTAADIAACLIEFSRQIRPERFTAEWATNRENWAAELKAIASDKAVDE